MPILRAGYWQGDGHEHRLAFVLLAVGFYSWVIALLFAVELAVGVTMVHWKEGWFVVGAGRNGVEYSTLLIASFLAVAYANYKK